MQDKIVVPYAPILVESTRSIYIQMIANDIFINESETKDP